MHINNTINWDITCDRFVVYLDILGFKDMIYRESHDNVYKKLLSVHELMKSVQPKIKQEDGMDNIFYISQFSDSIIIISKDDSYVSFGALAIIMRHIVSMLIIKGIAIKGACAHGKITIDREKLIFFGQPLIDAYLLEEDVYYYGIVCHNSFEKQINEEDYIRFYKKFVDPNINIWQSCFFTDKTKLKSGDITHANID